MAKLCTLRLLHQLDSREAAQAPVKCVAFAAPALGNAALATLVLQQGWSHVFYNLTLPGTSRPCASVLLRLEGVLDCRQQHWGLASRYVSHRYMCELRSHSMHNTLCLGLERTMASCRGHSPPPPGNALCCELASRSGRCCVPASGGSSGRRSKS